MQFYRFYVTYFVTWTPQTEKKHRSDIKDQMLGASGLEWFYQKYSVWQALCDPGTFANNNLITGTYIYY